MEIAGFLGKIFKSKKYKVFFKDFHKKMIFQKLIFRSQREFFLFEIFYQN